MRIKPVLGSTLAVLALAAGSAPALAGATRPERFEMRNPRVVCLGERLSRPRSARARGTRLIERETGARCTLPLVKL